MIMIKNDCDDVDNDWDKNNNKQIEQKKTKYCLEQNQ